MQKSTDDIILFLIVVSVIILALITFMIVMLHLYRERQLQFLQNIEQIKLDHEKTLLAAQLEMQESTFQHISREIHDNINLSLTLTKLHLNTIDFADIETSREKIGSSISLLGNSITDLSNISKGLNTDIIIQQGLLNALENEITQIRQTGLFTINYTLTGSPVYMEAQKELIVFRVIQEAFNNIIKHAEASVAELSLHYTEDRLYISLGDNGKGFDFPKIIRKQQAGLTNIQSRLKMLQCAMNINTAPGMGTILSFKIPYN